MTDSESRQNDLYGETSEPVRRVLGKLRNVRRLSQGHYEAPCPLHNNGAGMLTVSEAVDGRALIECRRRLLAVRDRPCAGPDR